MTDHRRPIVVVTGASAGVGRATAQEFARRGYDVALIARGEEGLEGAAREVRALRARALVLPLDVAEAKAVQTAADRVASEWGGIDVWVNNAMVTVYSRVCDMSPEEYRRVTEVTYLGYVYGTLAALGHMRARDAGTIVQVGSALAYRAIPIQSAYCAAKFAIRGFTDALRSELYDEGSLIRVTMVQLPAVNTPQFDWARNRLPARPRPVGIVFQPEAIAHEIFRAAIEAPRELWIERSAMQAIVGNMVAPGLLDRYLAKKTIPGQASEDRDLAAQGDNLFESTGGDRGSHGRFDAEARRGPVFALGSSTVRLALGGAALFLFGVAARALASRSAPSRGRWRAYPRLPTRNQR